VVRTWPVTGSIRRLSRITGCSCSGSAPSSRSASTG
jgi:hypothetical protein